MLCYIHIPFCDSKCHYCSFNSYINMHDRIEAYMISLHKNLLNEIEKNHIKYGAIETLFIGGGTPSVVAPHLFVPIFETLSPYLAKNAEITSEANPNSASKEWLSSLYALGVNRISFGVQSFNNKKLKRLNRAHSANEAIKAIESAAKIGYTNLSLDIIYDLEGDTKESLQKDLEQAFALPINHLSCYELTIEKATQFYKEPSVKQNREELGYFLRDFIVSSGFEQYEVSNYGKIKSRHNLGYWQYKEYLGIGAGAVGFINKSRYYPHSNLEHYIQNPTYQRREQLSQEEILTEKIFLGLRSIVGINKSILPKAMQERADLLCKEKKLKLINNRYYNQEFFLSDALALFIMGY